MKNHEEYENPISPSEFDIEDFQENKVYAALSYLIFFLPYIACPKSLYARYHANQGLVLLISALCVWVITFLIGWLPVLGWLVSSLLNLTVLILVIVGIYHALTNKKEPLPIIGKFHIIS